MHELDHKKCFSGVKGFITRETFCFSKCTPILISLLVALSLAGCVSLSAPGVSPDVGGQKPTPEPTPVIPQVQAPFEQGEIVAFGETIYRKFIEMSGSGAYVVQEFYAGTELPRTNPYVMTRLDEVNLLLLEDTGRPVQDYRQLIDSGIGIDGTYVQWYRTGGKAIEGTFEGNFPVGQWVLTYENGSPMLQDTWSNGARNGSAKGWHENGVLAGEGEYANNLREGVWVVWYPNGSKMQEGLYNQGQQDGEWTYWFENNSKKEAGSYVNGVRFGVWRWWTDNGALAREAEYDEMGNMKGVAVGSGRIQPRHPIY